MVDDRSTDNSEEISSEISPTVQARMRGSGLPTQLWHLIDLDLWYTPADRKSAVEHLLTRIACATVGYKDYDDGDTIQVFQEDFEGWTIDMFDKLPSEARKYFRYFIRAKGVYTGTKRGKVSQQLVKLFEFDPDNLPEWNDDLLRETEIINSKSKAYKKRQELLSQGLQPQQETPQAQTLKFKTEPQSQPLSSFEATPVPSQPQQPGPHASSSLCNDQQSTLPLPEIALPYDRTVSRPPFDRYYDPHSTLPPIDFPNQRLDPAKSTQFVRMYEKASKYTGEPYDLLDDKMKIFLNVCFHIDIESSQFHAVFPRILTGRAEHFYQN
ncbi:hypothetical protein K3495_g5471 [Podosphaera aphanis]|nr:hypothetical protein K3495_g5471 [Podosphaera aphanis]